MPVRSSGRASASRSWRERELAFSPDLRPARGPSPLQVLLEDEKARLVREALGALAPLHREVLILADNSARADFVAADLLSRAERKARARRKTSTPLGA